MPGLYNYRRKGKGGGKGEEKTKFGDTLSAVPTTPQERAGPRFLSSPHLSLACLTIQTKLSK